MQLTESWRDVVPQSLLERYAVAETRNAAMLFAATHPEEFDDFCRVLDAFYFDVDRIVRPGGSKHLIAIELDEAFRELGWREGKYDQELTTTLTLQPYRPAGERWSESRKTSNSYGGHKIDNVKGRVGLDVEWNPKDGNLDRDFSNFRALYDGGAIDVGVILTRVGNGMRELWSDIIAQSKEVAPGRDWGPAWRERISKTPIDPLGTTTTSNFEKLMPRVERGDGGGCPILAIAITPELFVSSIDLRREVIDLAQGVDRGYEPQRLGHRMGLLQDAAISEDLLASDD